MKVKGTAVKTIPEFIQAQHADKFVTWLGQLPEKSRHIFNNGVKASDWYSVEEAIIEPTRIMSEVCYNHPTRGAWECGRYSAEAALKGIYKIYVKFSSPGHIIDRAGRVLQAYYEPSELQVVSKGKDHVKLHITKFPKPSPVIDNRFAGWMEKALEISGCQDIEINIPRSFINGDSYTEFDIRFVCR